MEKVSDRIYSYDRNGRKVLKPVLVMILASACGLTVANLYWAQPLLDTIAGTFQSSTATAGFVVTLTQIGYAAGLLFLVPLGDILEKRRLIVAILGVAVVGLIAAAISPSLSLFLSASLLIGFTSVVAQILVPFAATLASDFERGKVVGQVMSGLLLGILLARTLAGLISEAAGWRAVFAAAALLIIILTFVLKIKLPQHKTGIKLKYSHLLKSVLHLFKEENVLRRKSVYGALVFANFSVLWTSLTFLLANKYHFGDAVIGLFGLVGAAGALSANVAGRLADKGFSKITTGFFLFVNLLAFGIMFWGSSSLFLLITGIILLDLGVQGTHITNQTEIYKLRPEVRSRLTTGYMTSFFIGGAIGSATSAIAYELSGWTAVCLLGIFYSLIAVIYWLPEFINRNTKTM